MELIAHYSRLLQEFSPSTESMDMKHLTATTERKQAALDPAIVAEESKRLLSIFEAHQHSMRELGIEVTQAEFGAESGIGSQGMVWQYLHARKPLGLEAAERFARALRCKISDFSPRLARLALRAAEVADGGKTSAVPIDLADLHELLERALRKAGRPGVELMLRMITGDAAQDEEIEAKMPVTKRLRKPAAVSPPPPEQEKS